MKANEKTTAMEILFRVLIEQGCMAWGQISMLTGFSSDEIKCLVAEGYLILERSYFDHKLLCFATEKVRLFLESRGIHIDLTLIQQPPIKNERHDLALIDIRIILYHMGYLHWQSERLLLHRGMRKMTPDAILSIGRRKIAIELEMTKKGEAQYREKFEFYKNHRAIDAVIYFAATPTIRSKLLQLTQNNKKIFVVLLKNLIDHKEHAYIQHFQFPGAVYLSKLLEVIRERRFALTVLSKNN